MSEREDLAEVIDGHDWSPTVVDARFPFRAGCSCGWIGEVAGEPWDDFRRAPWPNPYAAALRAAAGTPTRDNQKETT